MVLEGVAGIPVFGCCNRIFLQEFLEDRDRNSFMYSGFLRIPPDSSRFLRFPVPAKKLSDLDQRLKKALCQVKYGLK